MRAAGGGEFHLSIRDTTSYLSGCSRSTNSNRHFKFTLYKERVGDIVELAKYSYVDTPEQGGGVVGGTVD